MSKRQTGFTLMELLTSISIATILTTVGVPTMQNTLEKRRLSSAAEELYGNLQLMRAQAIKQNRNGFVSFQIDGGDWRYGLDDTAACDTSVADDCTVHGNSRVVSSELYHGVSVTQNFAGNVTGFEPRRGFALNSGDARLSSDAGEIRVVLLRVGQLRLCSPAGAQKVLGYADCE
ncbi:MAG: GspH/FimT family pseudopilin [Nevskiales bacterium]